MSAQQTTIRRNFRVAHFIEGLKKEDGVCRVLMALGNEMLKRRVEGVFVAGWIERGFSLPLPVIRTSYIDFPLYPEYKLALPGKGKFEKRLDAFAPDILHIHSPGPIAFAALSYARERNLPIIATHHTDFMRYLPYYYLSFLAPPLWGLLRMLYNDMNLVTTPSSETARELKEQGVERVVTLPWGVRKEAFSPSFRSQEWRRRILKGRKGSILLCVCRLTWEKDLSTLAATYKLLREHKGSTIAMAVVGSGPAREELESLMPEAFFLGHLGGRALSEAYASSDVFLFPSSTETFGNVTLEAMASGIVPVVADEAGSKSLVVHGKTGLLARARDPKDFFRKTRALLEDRNALLSLGKGALAFSRHFSWDSVFTQLASQYALLAEQGEEQGTVKEGRNWFGLDK